MTENYENLQSVQNDIFLLMDQLSRVLAESFNPKLNVEAGTLAACIRMANSQENIKQLGLYFLNLVNTDDSWKRRLPTFLSDFISIEMTDGVKELALGDYVLRSCRTGRASLAIKTD